MDTTDNVLFADNYYETDDLFAGSWVAGAHNSDLTSLGLGHSDIHVYYDDTINFNASDGFIWSRVGAGARPTDGLMISGTARTHVTPTVTGANVWDNVTIPDQNANVTLVQGASLPVKTLFLDANRDATITVAFDNDANPQDGIIGTGQVSTTNTTISSLAQWTPSLSTASLSPGTYRILAKITNGTHTRYFYAPGKLTVTTPPDTTKPTAAASAAAVTTAGATSYTFTVTYSDNVAVKASTIDGNDLLITGPNGFSQLASLVSVNATSDGTPRTATYRITPPGGNWDTADNGAYTLNLQAGQIADTSGNTAAAAAFKTFGVNLISTTGSITGVVYNDADADGAKSRAEKKAIAAVLYLDLNNDGVRQTNEPLTSSSPRSGNYAFLNVAPGTYTVRQIPPAGFRQTLPRRFYSATVASGQTVAGLVFGDTSLALLAGTLFNDLDASGARTTGEAGMGGWQVFLDTNGDGKHQKREPAVLTDSAGRFAFNTLPAGTFLVRVAPQAGWSRTTPKALSITLGSGQVSKGNIFGLKQI